MDIFPHSSAHPAEVSPAPASSVAPTNEQLRDEARSHIGEVFIPQATTVEESPAAVPEATAPALESTPTDSDDATSAEETLASSPSDAETTDATEANDTSSESDPTDVEPAETAAPVTEPVPAEVPTSDVTTESTSDNDNVLPFLQSLETVTTTEGATEDAPTAGNDGSPYEEVFTKLKDAGADVDSMSATAFMQTVEEYGAASAAVESALHELSEAQARVQVAEAERQALLDRYLPGSSDAA